MTMISYLDLLIHLLIGVGVCCFFAAFAQPIRALVQGLFAVFYHPLNAIMENMRDAFRGIWNWVGVQLRRESDREGESPLYFVIGAILYSILFIIFALCDFGLILLTLEAMGLDAAKFKVYDTSTLTAVALISISLFWGTIFTDLIGWTHLGPWKRYSSERTQKIVFWTSLAIVSLTIFTGASMGYWRMWNLRETMIPSASAEAKIPAYLDQGGSENSGQGLNIGAEPSQIERVPAYEAKESPFADFVFLMAPAVIAGLSLVSTVPAGWGVAFLSRFAILLGIAGISMVIALIVFPFWLISILLRGILTAIQLFLDLLAEIGGSILRLLRWRTSTQTSTATQAEAAAGPSQPAPQASSPAPIPGPGHQAEIGFNPFRRQS
ncbi:MAG: hypothetical protein QME78_15755 [Thermodesulfobacteriota bacterium]|nr:hypothetical protein [Thermodesulfobacteriota bacterium]